MAADKTKFCFKTSLPLENSSRGKLIVRCGGRIFPCLTTEHRPHSTCPAHSYQQPDPTAPPPPPSYCLERSALWSRRDQFYCAAELRRPPQNIWTVAHRLQICSSERPVKHSSVYQTFSALRSRIYVHLQSVSFILSLLHDSRHSCPARTKDKGSTWCT